jgi:hypothetical protein
MKRSYTTHKKQYYELPDDVTYEIMMNLDYTSIVHLCQTSKNFQIVCQNDLFWSNKYKKDGFHILFLEGQDINKGMYQIANDIMVNGVDFYKKIQNKDFYQIYIYLPLDNDKTWIINDYIQVDNIYTGILKLTYYYRPLLGYFYRKTVVYWTNDNKMAFKETDITYDEFIELMGFFISYNYKQSGHTKTSVTYKSENENDHYNDQILYRLRHSDYFK